MFLTHGRERVNGDSISQIFTDVFQFISISLVFEGDAGRYMSKWDIIYYYPGINWYKMRSWPYYEGISNEEYRHWDRNIREKIPISLSEISYL